MGIGLHVKALLEGNWYKSLTRSRISATLMWDPLPEHDSIVGQILVTKVLGSVLSTHLLFALFGRQYETEVFAAVRVWLPKGRNVC